MRTLITFFLLSTAALAQTAARVDVPLLTTGPNVPSSGGPMPQALWLANATVKVCTHPSSINSCTPAVTFTDSTEATQCPSSAPLTRQPGSICVATTGASATAGFWYLGGLVDFYVSSPAGTTGPYVANAAISNSSLPASAQLLGTTTLAAARAITLGSNLFLTGTTLNATTGTASNPAGPATACNFANSSVTSFQADLAACAINSTSHALTSQILNGVQNAASYQTGGGNNGIANAAIGAQNQLTIADPTYSATEQYSFSSLPGNLPPQYHLLDLRQGAQGDFFHSWQQPSSSLINFGDNGAAKTTNCLWDGTPLFAGDFMHHSCYDLEYISTEPGLSFGNAYGSGFNAPLWRVAHISNYSMQAHGSGITQGVVSQVNNWGVGDTMAAYFYTNGEGGTTAASDEGMKGFGNSVLEDQYVFAATCTSGCTTGSTLLHTTVSIAAQGTNRYLIDKNQSTSTMSTALAASGLGFSTAVTVAATVPVSNAWATIPGGCGPYLGPLNLAPPFSASFTCTFHIISGAFDTTHLVCFGSALQECSIPTAVGAVSGGNQTVTLPVRTPHGGDSNQLVFQGGLAGYGIEFSAFNQSQGGQTLRYLIDVIGSTDAHTAIAVVYQKGSYIGALGFGPLNNTFLYGNWAATTLTNSGTTVSGVSAGGVSVNVPSQYNGATFTFSGASDSAFNAACTNFQWTNLNNFTCTIAGLTGSHTSATATASFNNGGVVLWPMAQVIDVQNETLTPPSMDGTLALEPNIVPFATSDPLEEPHAIIAQEQAQTNIVYAWNPWNKDSAALTVETQGAGYSGSNNDALGLFSNDEADSYWLGLGGIVTPPPMWHYRGAYSSLHEADYAPAPGGSVLNIGIQNAQKADALFSYDLFDLAGSAAFTGCHGNYVPGTNTFSFPFCTSIVFPQGPGQVTLPALNLTTTAGLYSAIGYNYTPYSNAISTAGSSGVWEVTGGAGTVTCAITDDFGDPACTLTNSSLTDDFNWAAASTSGYTALPANTAMTIQVRAKGAVGGELIGLQAGLQGAGVHVTSAWADYCVPFTTNGAFLTVLGQINLKPNETVNVANITVRPGPLCGPPLLTTGAGGSGGAQFTTPTPVNNAGTLNIGTLTLPNINGSTQCLQTSSTGVVSGTGSPCGSGGTTSTICSGTLTLSGTINTLTAGSAGTATCTGLASTDAIIGSFNGTPFGITGFAPSATGILTCALVPSTNTITAYCSNNTGSNITIGASAVINYRVVR